MAAESNINLYYEEQIASIAEHVMERVDEIHKEDPEREIDNLNDIIIEEIDTASIYYADQAYYLAKYHLNNGNLSDSIAWTDVWDMVFNDVEAEVDEQIRQKYGEKSE